MIGIIVFLGYTIFGVIYGFTHDYDDVWVLLGATFVLQLVFDIPYIFRDRNRSGSFMGSFFLLVPKFGVQFFIAAWIGGIINHNLFAAVGGLWGLIKCIVRYVRKKEKKEITAIPTNQAQ